MADNEIVKRVAKNGLVITSDIPLAAEVIEKGASALSPPRPNLIRGALGQSDKQAFSNQLDTHLTRYHIKLAP